MNRQEDFGGPSDDMDGFLYLEWHKGHGPSDEDEGGHILPLTQDVRGGQFGLFFCSIACLRGFLNHCLDRMEHEVQNLKATEDS